ncbi:MAG TPA: hypothetical protein VJU82_14890 [Acidobacteriaceae bacterium]|nr:hypothetical protein [Acidobacteriaceae bacterium]
MSEQPTPNHIMQIGLGFWASKTFLSAVEMGLFTELAQHPENLDTRSFAEKTYRVIRWTECGGHFAALEQPELLLGDLRAFIVAVKEGDHG